jgi:hypothetical protein
MRHVFSSWGLWFTAQVNVMHLFYLIKDKALDFYRVGFCCKLFMRYLLPNVCPMNQQHNENQISRA